MCTLSKEDIIALGEIVGLKGENWSICVMTKETKTQFKNLSWVGFEDSHNYFAVAFAVGMDARTGNTEEEAMMNFLEAYYAHCAK